MKRVMKFFGILLISTIFMPALAANTTKMWLINNSYYTFNNLGYKLIVKYHTDYYSDATDPSTKQDLGDRTAKLSSFATQLSYVKATVDYNTIQPGSKAINRTCIDQVRIRDKNFNLIYLANMNLCYVLDPNKKKKIILHAVIDTKASAGPVIAVSASFGY